MKKLSLGLVSMMIVFGFAGTAFAHGSDDGNNYKGDNNNDYNHYPPPQTSSCTDVKFFQKLKDNPNVVAYFTDGSHGIPGEADLHTGLDIVLRKNDKGTFFQWFCGPSAEPGKIDGDFTVWKVKTGDSCKAGWLLMPTPNPAWGDYLTPNVDYCTLTRDFTIKDNKIVKSWKQDDNKNKDNDEDFDD